MLKLSKAGKMPCRSWSLQALDTCPGSLTSDGALVPACQGCYATTGNYNFPNVKKPRVHNKEDWQRTAWADDMVAELDNDRYFRWFDSGDMYSLKLAKKILDIAKRTPWVKHWIPTRMHKFEKFGGVIAELEALPNVVVRRSSDSITGGVIPGATTSTIIPTVEDATEAMVVCDAYERDAKCGPCRACWDKNVKVIAYPQHGKKMAKVFAKIAISL